MEPYFALYVQSDGGEDFTADVSFALPNTMEDVDAADVEAVLTKAEMAALIDELDALCKKFPDRK